MPDGWEDPIYVLALDGGGFAALSPICTHLGCTVEHRRPRLVCPVSRIEYDREGRVMRGPAEHALDALSGRAIAGDELVIELG